MRMVMVAAALFLASGPAGARDLAEDGAAAERGFTECVDPRPVNCPSDPREPVCAELPRPPRDCWKPHCPPGMTTKTYRNACFACLDPTVTGYKPGKCSGQFSISIF